MNSRSFAYTYSASGFGLLVISRTTSSRCLNGSTAITGPKISSCMMRMDGETFDRIVGEI